MQEFEQPVAGYERHGHERHDESGRNPGFAKAREQRDQEAATQAYNEDI
jgi:hypothetical protein